MERREMLKFGAAVAAAAVVGAAIAPAVAATPTVNANTMLLHLTGGTTIPVKLADGGVSIASSAIDAFSDVALDYDDEVVGVSVSRDTYKTMAKSNLIDYIPDESGTHNVAVFFGRRLFVPGTKLAYKA